MPNFSKGNSMGNSGTGTAGNSFSNGPDSPKLWKLPAVANAIAITTSFWEMI